MGLSELICAAIISIGMPNANYACEHMDLVVSASQDNDIRPEVLVALIHVESRWTPTAVSHANACGLTQVIPKWTGGRASRNVRYDCEDLQNPVISIIAGATIFNHWLHRYGRCTAGNCYQRHYTIGLCGYNAGYRCRGENPNRSGMHYARVVLKKARQIQSAMRRIENANRENRNQ